MFDVPQIVIGLDTCADIAACRKVLLLSSLRVPPNSCSEQNFNEPGYNLNDFLIGKGANIHIVV